MLHIVFDKKLELVNDLESAIKYFEELKQFGLLRGRVNDRDSDLKIYYLKKLDYLKGRGLDISTIPEYHELPFLPCGDVFFRLNSYANSLEKSREEQIFLGENAYFCNTLTTKHISQ